MDCYNTLEEGCRKVKRDVKSLFLRQDITSGESLWLFPFYKLCILQQIFSLHTPQRENSISYHQWTEQHCNMFSFGGSTLILSLTCEGTIFITAQKIYLLGFYLKNVCLVAMLSFLLKGDSCFSLQIIISSEENSCTVLPP